jgi:phosphoribosyl-AMP cyclohydrolase
VSEVWLNKVNWNDEGLVPAIAQDADTGEILMMAWMNREALKRTVDTREAVYWSGHTQKVSEIRLDCDEDVVLLRVEQVGGIACHTGRRSCFYQRLEDGEWKAVEPVLKDPHEIYKK